MSKRLEAFIAQIRELAPIKADPAKGDAFEEELRSLFAEDDERSLELSDSINWILKQERSAEEKLAAIGKLLLGSSSSAQIFFSTARLVSSGS